jgi:hypothetical protein
MRAYSIRDYLLDIGTLSSYELAQMTWPGFLAEEYSIRNQFRDRLISTPHENQVLNLSGSKLL